VFYFADRVEVRCRECQDVIVFQKVATSDRRTQ
jgi:hypothetical protein